MSAQTKGLAALLAAHGRNGDTELVHVNKRELSALEQLGRRHGIETTTNPDTGLKEAFNWGSTIGAVAGGIGGTFAAPFTAGVINPYTGAALGSAAGTKLSGGSNQEALMNGVISGVTAWGIGGATDALAQAGADATKTAATEGIKTGVQETGQQALTSGTQQGLTQTAAPNAFNQVGQSGLPNLYNPSSATSFMPNTQPIPGGPLASLQTGAAPTTGTDAAGSFISKSTPVTLSSGETLNIPNSAVQNAAPKEAATSLSKTGTNPEYWSNVKGGIKTLDTPGKASEFAVANKGSLLAGGLGAYGMATDVGADQNTSTGGTAGVDKSLPGTEVYYTPAGERRTRVVGRPQYDNINMARGGDVYGDYDGADEAPDGGYHPGGGLNYAGGGGIGFIDSMQPGGKWGDITTDAYMAVNKNEPQWLKDAQPGGFIGATQPGRLGAQKRAEDEERRKQEEAAGIAAAAKAKQTADFNQQWSDRYGAPVQMAAAGGGISSLGHYSDGGQLLRGPGDGVSDSIPASIEGKRDARLADGEFVIPARAVSELGNGSTEAGSKQLYAMLDRIAKKRKAGKGLAYQANPKKIMPA